MVHCAVESAQRGKLRNREKQLIRLVYIALKNNNPHENDKALISQVAYKKNPQNGKRHNSIVELGTGGGHAHGFHASGSTK